MNYQGRVRLNAGGAPVPDSTGNTMVFQLYTVASGGSNIWIENWNGNVATASGLFNVVLGSFSPLNVPFDQQYWLGVSVNGDAEMAPRQPLTLSPYAFRAKYAENASVQAPVTLTATIPGFILSVSNGASGGAISATAANSVALYGGGGVGLLTEGTFSGARIFGIGGSGLGAYIEGSMVGVSASATNGGGTGLYVDNQAGGQALRVANGFSTFNGNVFVQNATGPNAYLMTVSQTAAGSSRGGIYAYSPASATAAVFGLSGDGNSPGPNSNTGIGVMGTGPIGLLGTSNQANGIGVVASVAGTGSGIIAENKSTGSAIDAFSTFGLGVRGTGVTGVQGSASATAGTGVLADSFGQNDRLALNVQGPARFDNVGGSSSVTFNTHVHFAGTVTGLSLTGTGAVAPLGLTMNSGVSAPLSVSNASGLGLLVQGGTLGLSVTAYAPAGQALYARSGGNAATVKATNDSAAAAAHGIDVVTNGGTGIDVTSANGVGVNVNASGNTGVMAYSNSSYGLQGQTGVNSLAGVYGTNTGAITGSGVLGEVNNGYGVEGRATGFGAGVYAHSASGVGVSASAQGVSGVAGIFTAVSAVVAVGQAMGVDAEALSSGGTAVIGRANLAGNRGVHGKAGVAGAEGVRAESTVAAGTALHSIGNSVFDGNSNTTTFNTFVSFTAGTNIGGGPSAPVSLTNTGSASTISAFNSGGGSAIYASSTASTVPAIDVADGSQNVNGAALRADSALGTAARFSSNSGRAIFAFSNNKAIEAQASTLAVSATATGAGSTVGLFQGAAVGLSATTGFGIAVYGRNNGGGSFIPTILGDASGTGMGVRGRHSSGAEGSLGGSLSGGGSIGVNGKGAAGGTGVLAEQGPGSLALNTLGDTRFDGIGNTSTFNTYVSFTAGTNLGGIGGSGTIGKVPMFTAASALGNSQIADNGTFVSINGATGTGRLEVAESLNGTANVLGLENIFTPGIGLGTALNLRLLNNTFVPVTFARLRATTTNVLAGSEAGYLAFDTRFAGVLAEKMRLDELGHLGIGASNPSSVLDLNGDLNLRGIPSVSAPGFAAAGEGRIYFDSTANKFKVSQSGGGYTDLVLSPGSFVQKTGDSMTGPLSVDGSPIAISATSASSNGVAGYFQSVTGVVAIGTALGLSASSAMISGVKYPTSDGTNGQFMASSGTGQLYWAAAPVPVAPISLTSSTAAAALFAYNSVGGQAMVVSATVSGSGALTVRNPGAGALTFGTYSIASGAGAQRAGVFGSTDQLVTNPTAPTGVYGYSFNTAGYGVMGLVDNGGASTSIGVYGLNSGVNNLGAGVRGENASNSGYGLIARNTGAGIALSATSSGNQGIAGYFQAVTGVVVSGSALGISVTSATGVGIYAQSGFAGIIATSGSGSGGRFFGTSAGGIGVFARGDAAGATGLWAENPFGGLAMVVSGNASIGYPGGGAVTTFLGGNTVNFTGATVLGLPGPTPPVVWVTGTAASDFPKGVLTVTNTGNGHGIAGYATKPGAMSGGNLDLGSQLTSGVQGFTDASFSAGVLGKSADMTGFGAGVFGLGYKGMIAQGLSVTGAEGMESTTNAVNGTGIYARADSGLGGYFKGLTGVVAVASNGGRVGLYGASDTSSPPADPAFKGVFGYSSSDYGVYGLATGGSGVGVVGVGIAVGVSATSGNNAGRAFYGRVNSSNSTAEFVNDGPGGSPLKLNNMRFPSSDGGTNGYVLKTDGAGNLSFGPGSAAGNSVTSTTSVTAWYAENTGGGVAVYGKANVPNKGVVTGENSNSNGAGAAGINTASGPLGGAGVFAQAFGEFGQGLNAVHSPASGNGNGSAIYATSTASNGYAIVGESPNIGISTTASSNNGVAAYFQAVTGVVALGHSIGLSAAADTLNGIGVAAFSSFGMAIYARNFGGGGFVPTIFGEASGTGMGVRGHSITGGGEGSLGGTLNGGGGTGVHGRAGSSGYGVFAEQGSGFLALYSSGDATFDGASNTTTFNTYVNFNGGTNFAVTAPLKLTSTVSIEPAIYAFNSGSGTSVLISGTAGGSGVLAVKNGSASSQAYGILSIANGTGATRVGVVGSSSSNFSNPTGPVGVYGYSFNGPGMLGLVDATNNSGTAVVGQNFGTTNTGAGVKGENSSATGSGVTGYNSSGSGNAVGVSASTASNGGYAGLFQSSYVGVSATGSMVGVYGQVTGTSGNSGGVIGLAFNTSPMGVVGMNLAQGAGAGIGVYGEGNSITGIGVKGRTNGSGIGVYGVANNLTGYAMVAENTSSATGGSAIGLSATSAGASGVAGYFQGVTAVVATTNLAGGRAIRAINNDGASNGVAIEATAVGSSGVGLWASAPQGAGASKGVIGEGGFIGVSGVGGSAGSGAGLYGGGALALDADGPIHFRGKNGGVGTSSAGNGRIYYDSGTARFRVSEGGGPYFDLMTGAGGFVQKIGDTMTGTLNVGGTALGVSTTTTSPNGVGLMVQGANGIYVGVTTTTAFTTAVGVSIAAYANTAGSVKAIGLSVTAQVASSVNNEAIGILASASQASGGKATGAIIQGFDTGVSATASSGTGIGLHAVGNKAIVAAGNAFGLSVTATNAGGNAIYAENNSTNATILAINDSTSISTFAVYGSGTGSGGGMKADVSDPGLNSRGILAELVGGTAKNAGLGVAAYVANTSTVGVAASGAALFVSGSVKVSGGISAARVFATNIVHVPDNVGGVVTYGPSGSFTLNTADTTVNSIRVYTKMLTASSVVMVTFNKYQPVNSYTVSTNTIANPPYFEVKYLGPETYAAGGSLNWLIVN